MSTEESLFLVATPLSFFMLKESYVNPMDLSQLRVFLVVLYSFG